MRFRSIFPLLIALAVLAMGAHARAQDHAQDATPQSVGDAAQAVDSHADNTHELSSNPMQFSWVPFVSALVVFGAAFFILSKTAWPKILTGLAEREEKIRSDITGAEQARRDAESALAEYQRSLSQARTEAGKIIEQAKVDQMKVVAEIKSKTQTELNQMRDAAKRDIEQAKKQAVTEIYSHMATLATDVASKILAKELTASDQQKLVEESLSQLQPVGSGS